MHFDLSTQELIGLLASLLGAFWGLGKMLILQTSRQIDTQFSNIAELLQKQQEFDRRLEREMLELKAALPREYVRREDYVQQVATILTKLDAMQLRTENLILQAKDFK